ncbi:hypothetical protein GCM10010967_00610 [Dyadobacter beijingensis]|uniref:CAAX protease self-immunity n=1 Tax=Dyadobacter beijingensis TaxID=365489 RepID=A0ABQ2HBZ8_9BACT|nr:hypothetical protein [Dyadobacter beijingensis]GGM73072.1 hypothetical protein GCM10010967_00610 [Dyadobacter beijingensis]
MHYSREQLIVLFTYLPVLLAAVMAFMRYRKARPPVKLLCWLIFFALFIESISRVLWFFKTSNLFLWPVYIVVEFGLLLWMFSLVLEQKWLNRARIWVLVFFVCVVLIREFGQKGQSVWIDNAGRSLESAMVIFLALAYFYKVFQELKVQNLLLEPFFWVSAGLLLFFSGNFLIFVFMNFILLYSKNLNDQIWVIHALMNYMLYITYAIALWVGRKK